MTVDLTQAQTEELEQMLRDRYAHLQDEVRTALEETGNQEYQEIIGRVRDSGEESLATLIADTNLTRLNRLSDEARAIERALQEIDSGGYGICYRCGQPIGYQRLKGSRPPFSVSRICASRSRSSASIVLRRCRRSSPCDRAAAAPSREIRSADRKGRIGMAGAAFSQYRHGDVHQQHPLQQWNDGAILMMTKPKFMRSI